MYGECNNVARLGNYCCSVKSIIVKYSDCDSLALVIQHFTGMRRILYLSAACLAAQHFSTERFSVKYY
jgi:hypothetical protein